MDTRTKLEEASYFLMALMKTKDKAKYFIFNLSAFISAWRSVLDVMLYDFAEHLFSGLTREEDKITRDIFQTVAKAQKSTQGLKFIEWYEKKCGTLSDKHTELWHLRHIIHHRGYPEMRLRVFAPVSDSCGVAGIISKHLLVPTKTSKKIQEFPLEKLLDECKHAFHLMESIVYEAEKKFNIQL